MDILKPEIKDVVLHDVKCEHNVSVPSRYGSPSHVLVFTDTAGNCYVWMTSTNSNYGFLPGEKYNIMAKLNTATRRLTHVKELRDNKKIEKHAKSEQPDAQDVLLGLADYNKVGYYLDFKLKM